MICCIVINLRHSEGYSSRLTGSGEQPTRQKYQLNGNDHVNKFGIIVCVHCYCSSLLSFTVIVHIILAYGCWSLSASLYLQGRSERRVSDKRVSEPATKRRTERITI